MILVAHIARRWGTLNHPPDRGKGKGNVRVTLADLESGCNIGERP